MKLYMIFLSLICYIHWWKYQWNKAVNFFLRAFAISKSVGKIIIDGLIDKPQVTNKSFPDRVLPSMSSSVKFVPTNWDYKYQQKILSVNLKIGLCYFMCCIIIFWAIPILLMIISLHLNIMDTIGTN
jgi:hypothetical protein